MNENDKKSKISRTVDFIDRHRTAILVTETVFIVGLVVAPKMRAAVSDYRQLQENAEEAKQLLRAMWDTHPVNLGLIEARENNS